MTPSETIAPHGGTLVDLLLTGDEAAKASEESEHLPKVAIGRRELSDLEMLAVGALSPLTGFVGEKDYHSVLEDMHLSNGLVWTIPVTLSVDEDEAKRIGGTSRIALVSDGRAIAVVDVEQVYRRDREKEAASVFRTNCSTKSLKPLSRSIAPAKVWAWDWPSVKPLSRCMAGGFAPRAKAQAKARRL